MIGFGIRGTKVSDTDNGIAWIKYESSLGNRVDLNVCFSPSAIKNLNIAFGFPNLQLIPYVRE